MPIALVPTIILCLSAVMLYQTGWFLAAVAWRRNDLADISWGLGFILVAGLSTVANQPSGMRTVLILIVVSIWGLRLSSHIARRNWNKPEDARYAAWRHQWGRYVYLRSYLQVFILQGILLLIVALPILVVASAPATPLSILDLLGTLVFVAGFGMESIADNQLARFRNTPSSRGHLLRSGLWKFSRHPNYFGEVLQWWGMGIIALSVPFGFLGLIGAATITFLILRVSGIPLLEEKMRSHPEFADYAATTNAFIPWLPRRS